MKLYKLTNEKDQTYGKTQWGENIEHTTDGSGNLCGPGWLHAYTDPLLAILLSPIHTNFNDPHLWEAEGDVGKTDHGLKVGCTRLRTVRRIKLPKITVEQRVRFAILCAWESCQNSQWRHWATNWLLGKDRTPAAAWAAAQAAAAWTAEAAEVAARAAEVAARIKGDIDLARFAKRAMSEGGYES